MTIVFAVLMWLAVVLGTVLLVALLVPVSVRARGGVHGESTDGVVDARWGGGIVRLTIGSGEEGQVRVLGLPFFRVKGKPHPENKDEKDEKAKEKEPGERRRKPGAAWGHRRTLWMAMRRLLRTLHLRGRIEGTVGLADPADTGILCGLLSTVGGGSERFVVAVDCDWTDETLELDGTVRGLLWPLQVVAVGLALWVRRDVRRALRAMRGR
ncbi:MAG: DUF2953 domain-containing protein [Deltaproteobacteria bacterium]|nr:DUF2953 domain-containing protein [Deltaproteobacteria bacterium]